MAAKKKVEKETVPVSENGQIEEAPQPEILEGVPLRIQVPSSKSPGFLRRLKQITRFQQVFEKGQMTIDGLDALTGFLVNYVKEPADKIEAVALLEELSEEQFLYVLSSISGGDAEEVPPAKNA